MDLWAQVYLLDQGKRLGKTIGAYKRLYFNERQGYSGGHTYKLYDPCLLYTSDSPDFDILIFGYAWDDDPVQVLSLIEGDELPQEVFYALTDHHVDVYKRQSPSSDTTVVSSTLHLISARLFASLGSVVIISLAVFPLVTVMSLTIIFCTEFCEYRPCLLYTSRCV